MLPSSLHYGKKKIALRPKENNRVALISTHLGMVSNGVACSQKLYIFPPQGKVIKRQLEGSRSASRHASTPTP